MPTHEDAFDDGRGVAGALRHDGRPARRVAEEARDGGAALPHGVAGDGDGGEEGPQVDDDDPAAEEGLGEDWRAGSG